ncbi:ABC transporter ATP-binding protein [Cohnella nanjingensis]|uniref:ABC transporter ATP-binding protein n=1 Tax=Cohnella nanjingensis TaxID=1387779 RepID=A0A7X0RTG4_9BACL|nr:ABC transporter ATP-binding protein [Cohnella nanjingensis]MBB6673379.1 ABC transporter ATP-binding protein [Cohnella nanjingensis]
MNQGRTIKQLIKREGFKIFLQLCMKYKHFYGMVLLLQLLGTGVSLLLAETGRRLIDTGSSRSPSTIAELIFALAVFILLGLVISYFTSVCNQIINTKIVFQMRQMALRQLLRLSLSYHESKHSSQANHLLFNELEVFKQFIVFDVIKLVSLPFSFIAIGVYMMSVNAVLGIVSLCIGPLQLFSNLVTKKAFKELVARQQANGGEVFHHMGEAMAGIREIKMNQLERPVLQKFGKVSDDGIRLWISIEKMEAFREFVRVLPEKLGYLIGMGVGAFLIANGSIGPGALIAFIALLDRTTEPFASIVGIIGSLQRVSSGAERLLDLMEMSTENDSQGRTLESKPASIQFDGVHFAYEENRPVLRNVTFTVPAGKTLALVGPSGGGKSTIVKLLYRFYHPGKGALRINDHPIEEYSLDSLRRNLSAVAQDVYLFDDTIGNNMAVGVGDIDKQELYLAAKLSQSLSFIEKWPEQFETRVGERGIKLSQGQKQRIAIARAILRKPSILILDEPTSALDVETEAMFQASLSEWAGDATKIIIAHRLSTIRDADYVAFLEDGEICEFGSPRELIAAGGRFADFWRKQEIVEFAI